MYTSFDNKVLVHTNIGYKYRGPREFLTKDLKSILEKKNNWAWSELFYPVINEKLSLYNAGIGYSKYNSSCYYIQASCAMNPFTRRYVIFFHPEYGILFCEVESTGSMGSYYATGTLVATYAVNENEFDMLEYVCNVFRENTHIYVTYPNDSRMKDYEKNYAYATEKNKKLNEIEKNTKFYSHRDVYSELDKYCANKNLKFPYSFNVIKSYNERYSHYRDNTGYISRFTKERIFRDIYPHLQDFDLCWDFVNVFIEKQEPMKVN